MNDRSPAAVRSSATSAAVSPSMTRAREAPRLSLDSTWKAGAASALEGTPGVGALRIALRAAATSTLGFVSPTDRKSVV